MLARFPTWVAVGLLLSALAWAPLLPWYTSPGTWGPDGRWGLLSLATALLVILCARPRPWERSVLWSLLLVLGLAAGALVPPFPPLLRGILAATALAVTVSTWRLGVPLHPGLWGLLLLALPVLPVWHAHAGYPLRVLTAGVACPLLNLAGLGVTREGTVLHALPGTFDVAEPCSGVRKLWAALYLACALASFRNLSTGRTVLLAGAAMLAAVAGNILRVSALFHLEIVLGRRSPFLHQGVGLTSFALVAGLVLLTARRLSPRSGEPCSSAARLSRFDTPPVPPEDALR